MTETDATDVGADVHLHGDHLRRGGPRRRADAEPARGAQRPHLHDLRRGSSDAVRSDDGALPRDHRRRPGVLLGRRREADHEAGRRTRSPTTSPPTPRLTPARRRAAPHRRPGDRRGERRRRRLGHGAGGHGRHPRGVGAGEVRRAVRQAGPELRRARARAPRPAGRPGARPPSCCSPVGSSTRAEAKAIGLVSPRRAARRAAADGHDARHGDRVEPAARRPGDEAGPPPGPRPGLDEAGRVGERQPRPSCSGPQDHREGVAAFLEKREPRYEGR